MRNKTGIVVVDHLKGKRIPWDRLPKNEQVLVGIPADHTSRPAGGITNAALGYIHETGAPEANIPARPFLLPGIRSVMASITKYLKQAAEATMDGNDERAQKALHAAGLSAVSGAQRKITEGPFEPLKPSTLRRRRSRGRTGTKPLIDTGQLRRSLTHVLRTIK